MAKPFREPTTNKQANDLHKFLTDGAVTTLENLRVETARLQAQPVDRQVTAAFAVQAPDLAGLLKRTPDSGAYLELEFEKVTGPGDPNVFVFLTPQDSKSPTVDAAERDPTFVGAVAFFSHGASGEKRSPMAPMPLKVRLNATAAVRHNGGVTQNLKVVVQPAPVEARNRPTSAPILTAARINILRSIVKERS